MTYTVQGKAVPCLSCCLFLLQILHFLGRRGVLGLRSVLFLLRRSRGVLLVWLAAITVSGVAYFLPDTQPTFWVFLLSRTLSGIERAP